MSFPRPCTLWEIIVHLFISPLIGHGTKPPPSLWQLDGRLTNHFLSQSPVIGC